MKSKPGVGFEIDVQNLFLHWSLGMVRKYPQGSLKFKLVIPKLHETPSETLADVQPPHIPRIACFRSIDGCDGTSGSSDNILDVRGLEKFEGGASSGHEAAALEQVKEAFSWHA